MILKDNNYFIKNIKMPTIKIKYKVWETKTYFIEAIIENIWWEEIINKNIEKKLNLVIEQIIKRTEILSLKRNFSISILFTGDKKINQLNNKFRKINSPTNVLSFPSIPSYTSINNFLGDIVISSDTLIKEARDQNKTEEDHFAHLFIHSVLHLLGYDHENSCDANIMEKLEIKILKSLNINNPYKEII